jgi:hypothetical protein
MGNRRQNRPHRRNSSQAQNIHPSQMADRQVHPAVSLLGGADHTIDEGQLNRVRSPWRQH